MEIREKRTDSELGRSLLTERGMQWLHAHGGDPYAQLLRAEDDDRWALAERIRELGPLHRSRTGAWITGSYALGAQILGDPRLGPRAPTVGPGAALGRGEADLGLSRADGGNIGKPSGKPAGLNPRPSDAERLCEEALGRVGGVFDLTADLIRPVLVLLVGELLAVPDGKRARFDRLCGSTAAALDAVLCPPTLPRALALIGAVDGLRSLLTESAGPEEGSVAAGMLASVVGVEVAADLAANTLLALLGEPGRWRRLGEEPGLAEAAVEETLRHDPPVRLDSRVAREDLDLAGRTVAAGEEVVVHIDAANRDAASDARHGADGGHLSLFDGTHFGAVAPLALASAAATLRVLAAGLPTLHRAGPVVRRLRAPVTRAVVRFPVAV